MTPLTDFIEDLLDQCQERRAQPRTQVELSVDVLCVQRGHATRQPVLIKGLLQDVSSAGALLTTVDRLPQQRVWLKLPDRPGRLYIEADVVRTAPPQIPLAHSYGLQFSRVVEDETLAAWIDDRRRHSPAKPASSGRSLAIVTCTVGDVISLG